MFIMQTPPLLSHCLMTMDWLFLRLLNTDFSCNVRFPVGFSTQGGDGDEVLFSACKKVV